jgi:hypothetical protein
MFLYKELVEKGVGKKEQKLTTEFWKKVEGANYSR